MKSALALVISILAIASPACGEASFQNLDFESANVPVLPPGEHAFVSLANALPGWTGYYGANIALGGVENAVSLGAYNISILGPDFEWPGNGITILEGNYSAVIQAGINPPVTFLPTPTALSQTATVPSGAMSIQMKVRAFTPSNLSGFVVSVGGQTINMVPLQVTAAYVTLGGDVSDFAGQMEELRLTVLPLPDNSNDSFELDSIVFSPQAIPEPGAVAIVGIAGMFAVTPPRGFRAGFRPFNSVRKHTH